MVRVGIKDFALAVLGDYWARMSGPASVPAAVLALWLSNDAAKIGFALTGFFCAWITAYRVWKPEREKNLAVAESIERRARLQLSFDMNDPGCVRRNTTVSVPVTVRVRDRPDLTEQVLGQANCDWYRIRIDAENGNLPGCQAHLMSVARGGSPLLSGEVPPLPIVHAINGTKTVHSRVPDYIDLLAIFDNTSVDFCVSAERRSSSIRWNMFDLAGEYRIIVAVTSPDAETALLEVIFRWNLNRTTAEIICAPKP